jgi:protein phosphatase
VTQLLTDELVIGEVLADDDGTRFTVSYAAPQVDDEATFDLLAPPPPVLLPVAPPPSVPQERGNGTTAAPPHGAHTVMLTAGQASHVGQVRPVDEDAAMAITMNALRTPAPGRQSLGLYLVADGMGGGFFGEVASALAMQTISKRLLAEVLTPLLLNQQLPTQNIGAIIVESVQDANTRITDFSICSQAQAGSTVTLALLIGAFAYIANVGDSRTYLYRQGTLRRISKDHSRVEEYVDQGLITPEMVYTHPERNGITRSLGVGWVQVDLFTEQLQSGDRLLLCCDGVWEMVHDAELAETIGTLPPQQSCDEIIRRANACGADDNISLVIVGVEPSQSE